MSSTVEDEVRAVEIATLAASCAADADAFVQHFHPRFTGFAAAGGLLVEGDAALDVSAMRAKAEAGLTDSLGFRHLDIRIYGDIAVDTGYMTGTVRGPGGVVIEGTWRYTGVWLKQDGQWKAIHAHFSPLTPPQGTRPG